MSREDVLNSTFDEIGWIVEQHNKSKQQEIQRQWEMSRFTAFYSVAPHTRKKIKVKDICEFEWEKADTKEQVKKLKEEDFSKFPKTLKKWE